jgi:hypothetical protein
MVMKSFVDEDAEQVHWGEKWLDEDNEAEVLAGHSEG